MVKAKINFLLFSIIILSFFPIFFGYNFFAEEDAITLFYHTEGNILGNGWRSDKGLGTSFFFGDPGAFHAWSILSIINKIFNFGNFNFYNFSVIILIFFGTASTANFLRNIHSKNVSIFIVLLSLLIFLNPMRYELLFQRHWIASTFSLPILIYFTKIFLEEKNIYSYFFVILSFSFSLYLGSIAALQNILLSGFIFFIVHCLYKKTFFNNLKRFVSLYLSSLVITFLIGLWVWYPILFEYFTVGYERSYTEYFKFDEFLFTFNLYNICKFLFSLFNSGIFPSNISLPDKGLLPLNSWINVNPIFPLIFIFYLFHSTKTYWEYISKNVIIIYFIHYFLISFLGEYKNIPIYLFNLYSWHKIFLDLYFFQIILMSFFILRIKEFYQNQNNFFLVLKYIFGSIIILIHSILLIFCFFSIFQNIEIFYSLINFIINFFINLQILDSSFSNNYIPIIYEILNILSSEINFYLVAFYLTTVTLISSLFFKKSFIKVQNVFIGCIVINSLFLGFGVYPMVKENLIWNKNILNVKKSSPERSAYMDLSIDEIYPEKNLQEKLDIWKNNSKNYRQVGYLNPPGISFSSILSHWSKDSYDFLIKNLKEIGFIDLRQISNGNNSLLRNENLLNYLSIKYLYFRNKPANNFLSNNLEIMHEEKGLYLYKNPNHFPYFYFGKKMIKEKDFDIKNLNKGDFVIKNEIMLNKLKDIGFEENLDQKINLINWKNGSFTFDYESRKPKVLIINDLWHPNWRVKINYKKSNRFEEENKILIFKANHIFKGLLLPKGNYKFELFYDTKKYNLGLYMSLIVIIMILMIFLRIKKNETN